ncbi:MAG: hypothetical protein ACKOQ2_33725, partial [Dolichospermum sp.]
MSIQDIDKRIDDKINQSIQNIDSINTLSIQDIDDRIIDSIKQGDIKDAIAKNYEAMMGQFNGLLEQLQELQKQVQELQSISPAPVSNPPIIEQLTTDNYQLPEQETGNRELGTGEHEDVDLVDSETRTDTQSPMTDNQLPPGDDLTEIKSDNSPALPKKDQTDYV